MKRYFILLLILAMSCSKNIKEELSDMAAESTKIVFYAFNIDNGEYVYLAELTKSEMIVDFINNSISNKSAPQYKCAYDGKFELHEHGVKTLEVEFSLKDDCPHFSFFYGGKVYSREISEKGMETLNAMYGIK